jgi:hypothetical protein
LKKSGWAPPAQKTFVTLGLGRDAVKAAGRSKKSFLRRFFSKKRLLG